MAKIIGARVILKESSPHFDRMSHGDKPSICDMEFWNPGISSKDVAGTIISKKWLERFHSYSKANKHSIAVLWDNNGVNIYTAKDLEEIHDSDCNTTK